MNLEVVLVGVEPNSALTASLKDWLQESAIEGVYEVKQMSSPHKEGELGIDWLNILQIGIDNIPVIISVASAVIAWRQATRSKVTVEIPLKNGTKIKIEGTEDENSLIRRLKELVSNLSEEE